jgi:hypothetical protein
MIQFERPYFHWCDDLPVPPTTVTSPFLRILTDEGLEGHCLGAGDVVDAGIEAIGIVRPWQTPGLGIEFDWDFLNAHTVGNLEYRGE